MLQAYILNSGADIFQNPSLAVKKQQSLWGSAKPPCINISINFVFQFI